ncbi:hypothetical protein IB238_00610 [Rhizobium sp. ARZ01]|uniref:hypothetical protein n=1 Tax=Rhizobium sp. ARZ01 TaxID=2769313 RepID=UPI00177D6676|nr:hypothetical protein [Rhizobium sp. ARZ01]MBD9371139.1 hypothetical protein [Rhizobium sp. ARZ01]
MKEPHLTLLAGEGDGDRPRDDVLGAIRRVRTVVLDSAVDCRCRDRVADAIRGFEHFEQRREKKRLADAVRTQKRKITALLDLLGDFDPTAADEGELSEASLLLHDIASEAALGSTLLREMLRLEENAVSDGGS